MAHLPPHRLLAVQLLADALRVPLTYSGAPCNEPRGCDHGQVALLEQFLLERVIVGGCGGRGCGGHALGRRPSRRLCLHSTRKLRPIALQFRKVLYLREALSGTQRHSEARRGTQRHAEARRWHSEALRWHSEALSGTHLNLVAHPFSPLVCLAERVRNRLLPHSLLAKIHLEW